MSVSNVRLNATAKPNPVAAAQSWVKLEVARAYYGDLPTFSQQAATAGVVVDEGTHAPSAESIAAAAEALKTNAAAEARARAPLGAAYEALAARVADQPLARRALQQLLLDGKLTSTSMVGNATMLASLTRLEEQPLAPGLDRTELLSHLLVELASPTAISQRGKNTCAATTAIVLLDERNPAELARLVADLAAPAGKAALAGGGQLRRAVDWNAGNDGGRSPSMRLLQPALMAYAEGPIFSYDNTNDTRRLPRMLSAVAGLALVAAGVLWQTNWLRRAELVVAGAFALWDRFGGGLTTKMAARAQHGLLNEDFKPTTVSRFNREGAWKQLEQALQAGKHVPVGLWYMGGGGHEVLAQEIKDGYVYYANPWGTRERMGVKEFKASLIGMSLPR